MAFLEVSERVPLTVSWLAMVPRRLRRSPQQTRDWKEVGGRRWCDTPPASSMTACLGSIAIVELSHSPNHAGGGLAERILSGRGRPRSRCR